MKFVILALLGAVGAINHKSIIGLNQKDYGSQNVLDAEGETKQYNFHQV